MKRDYTDFVQDMLNAIQELYEITNNITYEEFEKTKTIRLSAERLFKILGEAANRIPSDLQEKYPTITWKDIVGMRNIIIHSYDKVDSKLLWNVIKLRLKPLEENLHKMLADF